MSDEARETEVALMVCADNPEEIAEEIARLGAIAGFALGDGETVPIRDVMFDTADRTLGRRGYVLRARTVGDRDLLTLKGESRASEWGGVQRLEIEGHADEATLGRIREALQRVGISLHFGAAIPGHGVKTLRAAGLHPIQDRQTLRRLRHLETAGAVFGELSVDCVSTNLGRRTARFYQVEVEAKGAERSEALGSVVSALEARFGDKLIRWRYGKTSTLFALMSAASKEGAEALVNEKGLLTAQGCQRLRAALEGE